MAANNALHKQGDTMSIDKSNPIKGVALRLDTDTSIGSKGEVIHLTQGRHCHLFQKRVGFCKVPHTQGVVLKDNTFVNRTKAFDIISKHNIPFKYVSKRRHEQIINEIKVGKELFSEDVW